MGRDIIHSGVVRRKTIHPEVVSRDNIHTGVVRRDTIHPRVVSKSSIHPAVVCRDTIHPPVFLILEFYFNYSIFFTIILSF